MDKQQWLFARLMNEQGRGGGQHRGCTNDTRCRKTECGVGPVGNGDFAAIERREPESDVESVAVLVAERLGSAQLTANLGG